MSEEGGRRGFQRLPFFYGWVIVAVAFVTMAIAVSARTAFSLLLPPLLDEFGWDRALAAGAISFGFLVSAGLSPLVGYAMDRLGPRVVVEAGVALLAAGFLLAPLTTQPWHLYATLGALVIGGATCTTYAAHSMFLPHWFMRRRALAVGIAFSGAGMGAVILLPWLESIIQADGWRASCRALAVLALVVLGPLNLLLWRRPEDIGLQPDGGASPKGGRPPLRRPTVVDPAWAAIDWTVARAARTARYWWIVLGYTCGMVAWYAVQVHQTEYLIEIGFAPLEAAWALGLVAAVAIPGQIALGALSDRIGREPIWAIACAGFAICYGILIALHAHPIRPLLYLMVTSQGLLGYAMTSVMGPIVAEIFEGRRYGSIFGTVSALMVIGGAFGPWVTGLIHDLTGSYRLAFELGIACCALSAFSIWRASPRKVRLVPGRAHKLTISMAEAEP